MASDFDFNLFRKRVALFDSNRAGERDTAFRQAMAQCEKVGLRFVDAVTAAYNSSNEAEWQARYETLIANAEKLSEQYNAEANANDDLRQQVEQLRAERDAAQAAANEREEAAEETPPEEPPADEYREPVEETRHPVGGAWQRPGLRLLALFAVIAARLLLFMGHETKLGHPASIAWDLTVNAFFLGLGVWLALAWLRAALRSYGWVITGIKATLLGAGLSVAFYEFNGRWPWDGRIFNALFGEQAAVHGEVFREGPLHAVVSNVALLFNMGVLRDYYVWGEMDRHGFAHYWLTLALLVATLLLVGSKLAEAGAAVGREKFSGLGFVRVVRGWF